MAEVTQNKSLVEPRIRYLEGQKLIANSQGIAQAILGVHQSSQTSMKWQDQGQAKVQNLQVDWGTGKS